MHSILGETWVLFKMIIKSNFEIRIHKIAVVFLYGMLGKSNYDRRVYRKNNKNLSHLLSCKSTTLNHILDSV